MWPQEIGRTVLALLDGIDVETPHLDRALATDRLQAYTSELGVGAPRVRWAPDLHTVRTTRVWPGRDRAHWQQLTGRQWPLLDLPAGSVSTGLHDGQAMALAQADQLVFSAVLGTARELRSVRRLVPDLVSRAEQLIAGEPAPRRVEGLIPLAQAAAAGLFSYVVGRHRDLVAIERPTMQLDREGRLHNWDGQPAAEWPSGGGLYFWRDVHMTDATGRNPNAATPARIASWANAERRRVAIERIGIEPFLHGIGGRVLQQDDYGRLWRSEHPIDGEPYVAVEVVNATAEPDGTHRHYFLRVPPTIRSARTAVAWTFGFDRGDYIITAAS